MRGMLIAESPGGGNEILLVFPRKHSCIKLGFAHASAAVRKVFASLSDGQPNPEGWQGVAGGRPLHPGRPPATGCQP
ncbi:MAG: hypothetical protein WCQ21_36790, partial [Verrucomicrobiota bacterium]